MLLTTLMNGTKHGQPDRVFLDRISTDRDNSRVRCSTPSDCMVDRIQSVPLRVLVVDDETNVRKILTISLETDGHDVTAVSNARDAIAEAARQPFDLAFVDLRLGAT